MHTVTYIQAMSSFSIRDILDLPEDTIRTLQAIKTPIEMPSETLPEESGQVAAKETDDGTETTTGKYLYYVQKNSY